MRSLGCQVRVIAVDADGARIRRSLPAQWRARLRLGLRAGRPSADVNLLIEHIWLQHLELARCNVAVPNPEWFDRHDMRFLADVDHVWSKTHYTHQIFSQLGARSTYLGFDSEDRYDATVKRRRTYFHLAGKSTMKGTDRLLRIWGAHPQWPPLIVVTHQAEEDLPRAANIVLRTGYLSDAELRTLQNQSMFHVCSSLTEGWGHYIVEALSVGAVALTTDAAPMNELVTPERGVLISANAVGRQRLATTHEIDEAALAAAVQRTLHMSEQECANIGASARRWFLENKHDFARRVRGALTQIAPLQMRRAAVGFGR